MYRYAQIDLETGEVISDSHLSGEVVAEDMIPLSDDFDLGWPFKKYINGEWVDSDPLSEVEPEPTQLDRIEEMLILKNEEIANSAVDNYTLELIERGLL